MAGPIGILVAQLGTPDAPTPRALRRYLREFLGDPRVIELNPVGRWLLLNLVILPRRPKVSAELYGRIWTAKGSPLFLTTVSQADGLARALGPSVRTAVGMRYGNPSIRSTIEGLCSAGAERLLLFSMFPQYSAATTGSLSPNAVYRWLPRRRVIPALRVVPPYGAHPAYVGAVAAIAREAMAALPFRPEKVLFSFHGIPRRYEEKGDPYRSQVEDSARRIARELGLAPGEWILAFQSRFGREEWLRPYTDETIMGLARQGVRRMAAICPGFTTDCLETIDEIGNLGREQFRSAGGDELALVPCLNTHPAWMKAMERIAREELAGWL